MKHNSTSLEPSLDPVQLAGSAATPTEMLLASHTPDTRREGSSPALKPTGQLDAKSPPSFGGDGDTEETLTAKHSPAGARTASDAFGAGGEALVCPFCKEEDFDAVGLKKHIQRWCDAWKNL